jgi:hypothetical protein
MVERLAANYHELEKAVVDRVQLSRATLRDWQRETRSLMRELSRMVALALACDMAGCPISASRPRE